MLHHLVAEQAERDPHAVALVSGGRRVSYGELAERISSLAALLAQQCEPGDRVLVLSENSLDMVVSLYAIPAAGAIATFANTRHTGEELAQLVDATTPALVLASPSELARVGDDLDVALDDAPVWSIGPGDSRGRASFDVTGLLDHSAVDTDLPLAADPGAVAWLIHTSGSTGAPKGVQLTHDSLIAAVTATAAARPLADDDVYLFPFPLFHVAAYNVLHAHSRGRPVVLMPGFDAAGLLELIDTEDVTVCSLAPTMLAMLFEQLDPLPSLRRLRQISYGASAMPLELIRRVHSELPACGLGQGYGMTELSGNAVFLSPEDHRLAATSRPDLLAAAGRPAPGVELRLVAAEESDRPGVDVEPGEAGEILVRADQVCAGYWNNPEATARSRDGEWLRTGDIGRIDDEGYLFIVDRSKDIIVSGGENVSSREVEDLLSTHPSVASVGVIATPHARWGEQVTAVVVVRPDATLDADELAEWTKDRIAGFKRPRKVEFVDALPLNASGKIDKPALRARFS